MQGIGLALAALAAATSLAVLWKLRSLRAEDLGRALEAHLRHELNTSRTELHARLDSAMGQTHRTVSEQLQALQGAVNSTLTTSRQEINNTLTVVSQGLGERFEQLRQTNEQKLESIRKQVEAKLVENLDKNLGVVKQMTEQLGDLKATNERIVEISKDINKLGDILQSPKLRGNFGEFELESLLRQIIPADRLRFQHSLGNGTMVDAAIELKEGLLPIDSKFPLSSFQRLSEPNLTDAEREQLGREFERAVRGHVDDIAKKYIVPPLTLDLAFMFVPAENVYYEILIRPQMSEYVRTARVIPVSPNSLYAYLVIIAIGFRRMRLEQEAERIEGILLALKRNFDAFKDHFRLIGRHLDNARTQFDSASRDVGRFDDTLSGLSLGQNGRPAQLEEQGTETGSERGGE